MKGRHRARKIIFLSFSIDILIVALVALVWGFLRSDLPKTEGSLKVSGLQGEVSIIRDSRGVPHIYADNEHDLFFAAGYAQAQDRWFQMDLLRLMTSGRLSEIAGKKYLEEDFKQRIIGFRRMAEMTPDTMSEHSRSVLQAFCDGVNACVNGMAGRAPIEHKLLKLATGYEPEPWRPEDTMTIALYVDWSLAFNWVWEALSWELQHRGDRFRELLPGHRSPCPVVVPEASDLAFSHPSEDLSLIPVSERVPPYADLVQEASRQDLEAFMKPIQSLVTASCMPSPVPDMASNSWVVSGDRTRDKLALLCNDPHLSLLLPSVWIEMHLSGAGYDVTGVTFPGTPLIAIGHNQHIAWGATTGRGDSQDLYLEKVMESPAKALYEYDAQPEPFKVMEEVLRFRDGKSLQEERRKVLFSRHGPIINPLLDWLSTEAPPMALRWARYDPSDILEGFLKANRSSSWEEFLEAAGMIDGPVQNWVFASDAGDIGYVLNGALPVRSTGDGTFPQDGSTSSSQWKGIMPFEFHPQIHNPGKGYVVTANNRQMQEGLGFPVGHEFDIGYRAERIDEMIRDRNDLDVQAMAAIQNDFLSARARRLLPRILEAFSDDTEVSPQVKQVLELLREWDYVEDQESSEATVFETISLVLPDLILGDELPDRLYEKASSPDRGKWPLRTELDNMVADMEILSWFDDGQGSTREEILRRAVEKSCEMLSKDMGPDPRLWRWGDRHVLAWEHVLTGDLPLPEVIKNFFTAGPFPRGGSEDTVNNEIYVTQEIPYRVVAGPSMRMVVTMTSPPSGQITNATGQAGQRMSPHYRDQMNDWLNGNYHPMLFRREDVEKDAVACLTLNPG